MKKIIKYPLEIIGQQKVVLPAGAEILGVSKHKEVFGLVELPFVWVLVPTKPLHDNFKEVPHQVRDLRTYGTGEDIQTSSSTAIAGRYLGTYRLDNGHLGDDDWANEDLHVFQHGGPPK